MYEQGAPPPNRPPPLGVTLDARRLWAGGVATAVVAALIGVVGIIIIRGLLDIHVLAPASRGTWESTSALEYAAGAFVGALVATALTHLLLLTTPRPLLFLGWIMLLVAVIAGVWPFTTGAHQNAKIATCVLNVIVVIAIWSLVAGSAQRSMTRYDPGYM
jgi:uncharacterized membrane protein YtjA (UPF0391 family)